MGGAGFVQLLRKNSNYRYTWLGQVVSEIGDYFNNIAVFSLVMETTGSGLVVSGVMLSRAIPAVLAGPVAGVVLDRFDRRRIMIASDLVRAVVALAFILTVGSRAPGCSTSAERPADVRLAVFHQRARGHPAHHRQPGGVARRQLPHPDHAVGHPDRRHDAGRRERGPLRLRVGFRHQLRLVPVLGCCHLAAQSGHGFRAAAPPDAAAPVLRPWSDYRDGLPTCAPRR